MQQIDAQGPAVVERITTQFAEVACTPDNARQLVEALHSGTAVTLSADGKTATFTPTTKLGYGEAYIALALAAEALRNAGVTGCATPDQWKAVLMGGPLSAAGTSTTSTSTSSSASSSSQFPGVLALRSQGHGWGQIAQTTNVQLGQVMSSASSSLNLSGASDTTLSPTGRDSLSHPGKGDEKGKGKGMMKGQRGTQGSGSEPPSASSPDRSSSDSSSTGTGSTGSSSTGSSSTNTDPSSPRSNR